MSDHYFQSSGSTKVVFKASGNVGIGTVSPSSKLHVAGDQYVTGQMGQGVAIANKISTYGAEFRTSGASAQIFFGRDGNAVGSGAIGADATYLLRLFKTDNFATPFVIKQTGEVGIGTASPDEKLHIIGSARLEQTSNTNAVLSLHTNSTLLGSAYEWNLVGNNSANSYAFQIRQDSTSYLTIRNSAGGGGGNVGIGQITPSEKLEVIGNIKQKKGSGYTNYVLSSVNEAQLTLSTYTGNQSTNPSAIIFSPNLSEAMRIDNAGNVGIGTTSPAANYKLHVAGGIKATNFLDFNNNYGVRCLNTSNSAVELIKLNSSNQLQIGSQQSNSNPTLISGSYITLEPTNFLGIPVEAVRVIDGGNVGIGTTNPSQKLHVAGNIELQSAWEIGSNDGSYWQRIRTEDSSVSTTNAFNFETRNGSGSFIKHMVIRNDGNVGIGVTNPSYALQVGGSIVGTSKNFIIDHPTKEGKKLLHACIEGPEAAVYFRGKSTSNIIEMPDYWIGLVDIDTMTVDITAIGPNQDIYVESIADNGEITIAANTEEPLNYFYVVYGERKDIGKLDIEIVDPEYSD